MSKLSTIVHLLNNGFTEQQVTAMMEAAYSMQQPAQAQMMQQPAQAQMMQQPAQAQAQLMQQPAQAQLMQQPAQAMMQQPAQAMMQQPAQAQMIQPDPYAAMNTKLDNIMGAVRAGAVMASAQPKQETADDVLGLMYANIIPPEGGNN